MKLLLQTTTLLTLLFAGATFADTTIDMHLVTSGSKDKMVGTITATNSAYGLILTPRLTDLKPGLHGFHLHVNPDCGNNGLAAGEHLDPAKTGKHLGPYDKAGHLGDLPALYVDSDGNAQLPVLAPRLTENELKNHALMLHAGGDNYSDTPHLGGGGARVACGVVK